MRTHARLRVVEGEVVIEDLGSRNGTIVNGERVASAGLHAGDTLSLATVAFELLASGVELLRRGAASADGATIVEMPSPGASVLAATPRPNRPRARGRPQGNPPRNGGSERDLAALGIDVTVTDVLALGSGLGSFVFVDLLRNSGVPLSASASWAISPRPTGATSGSAVTRRSRRTSGCARVRLEPDNPWGLPGYAVRERRGNLQRGDLKTTAQVLWSIFGELRSPRLHPPLRGRFRQCRPRVRPHRPGPDVRLGRIRTIRKTTDGRILAIASAGEGVPATGSR